MEKSLDDQHKKSVSIELQEWEEWAAQEKRKNRPKGIGAIIIAGLAALGKEQSVEMNSAVFTAGVTGLYEYYRTQKTPYKVPMFSRSFKQKFAQAFRGGLYASVLNALLSGKEWRFLAKEYMQFNDFPPPINGWKIIGGYIIVDFVSRYAWKAIKKSKSKPIKDTDNKLSPAKNNEKKQPSKLEVVLKWSAKALLATAIAKALT